MSEELVLSCFQLITFVGTARSCYINAIQKAKEGNFEEAEELMKQGKESFVQGHTGHADLLAKESRGELTESGLILIHAEDQLMSAEGFQIIAEEFIALYKKLAEEKQ